MLGEQKAGLSALALAFLAALCPAIHAQDAKDWPMYNRDVLGTRHNPAETALGKANAGRTLQFGPGADPYRLGAYQFGPGANHGHGPGAGFTHDVGDTVRIGTPRLGTLVNRVEHCERTAPWAFGIGALMANLARRGLL